MLKGQAALLWGVLGEAHSLLAPSRDPTNLEAAAPTAFLRGAAYRHVAIVEATEPLPAPAPQTAPPDGWWPHSVHDIVEAWALDEIAEWLQRCTTWHRRGGLAHERPDPAAFGTDAIKERARGRVWDLRDGPGKIKLFDPTAEPRRTCLDLGFADR